ncbi:outer membrane beta-barrel protein [Chryseobacterium sp. MEBOG06]|uniref:outer membrane beta-barrel protein n=1 Tax=Chryseobacterium sp. MEBOG06 TaxID=2879938 RepID=UPI001F183692|nr:outer membrane beta-barrel protein [Chryseobacterium sp. MEBOG06]UKB81842.1 outer membrane beta-barrel protein [Chryseobacterium sp. MEBOG06]
MKKIVLACAVALFGFSNAQIVKGTTYLSGQVEYSHSENNQFTQKRKDDVVKILPTAGYFVNTNLAIGLGAGYKSTVTKYDLGNAAISNLLEIKDTENAFVVAPFIRKYWTLSHKLYIFGQLQIPLEFGQEKVDANSNIEMGDPELASFEGKNNYTHIGINIKPGVDYFLSKKWSIEATFGEFGYNTNKRDLDGAKRQNNYKFDVNLASVTFGVKYVFAK